MRWILALCEVVGGAVGGTEEEMVGHKKVVGPEVLVELSVATIVGNVGISSVTAPTRAALH